MRIKIDIERGKSSKKIEKQEDKQKEKSNLISRKFKRMSLSKKITYGTIATLLATRAVDNLTKKEDVVIAPSQYENSNDNSTYKIQKNIKQIETFANPVKVEAKQILNDYTYATTYEEQKLIDELYKNKYLEVSGKVGEVVDEDTIKILNEDTSKWYSEWMSIECDFYNEIDLDKIQELQEGSEVNLVGYCNGYEGMTITIDDCVFKTLE